MRRRLPTALAALLIAVLGGLLAHARAARAAAVPGSGGAAATLGSGGAALVGLTPGISAHGNQLYVNGAPWVPRGVQLVGIVAPDDALQGKYVAAHAHFGAAELARAVADHADAVRFQVSQFGIDPQGPLYSPAYAAQVRSAAAAAGALGLQVIISLQAQAPAGEPNRCPLPDAGAQRAWAVLASMFASDRDVMFELYNEPGVPATRAGWTLWRDGGTVTYGRDQTLSCQAVGMQALIDSIRGLGAPNVIVVPGAAGEVTLSGMPALSDPANPNDPQLAYAVHYPPLAGGPGAWDKAFGATAADVPVIVTEWDSSAITPDCTADTPAEVRMLLDYLAGRRIGIVGFALDLPGTIVRDYTYAPTTFDTLACGRSGAGPGAELFAQYAAQAQAGDGAVQAPAPAWIVGSGAAERLISLAPDTGRRLLDTPGTFVTGADADALQALGTPDAIAAESYHDERALAAAISSGALRPGTRAIVYAPTHSAATPRDQQLHPGGYVALAADAAHAAHLLLIAAPSVSLARELYPHMAAAKLPAAFLHRRLAAAAARHADVYETEGTGLEHHPERYAAFVAAVSRQAAGVHRGIEVMSGLHAGATGRGATAAQLVADVSQSGADVRGYDLTVPSTGDVAATGGNVAVSLLRRLARSQSTAAVPAARGRAAVRARQIGRVGRPNR